MYPQKVVAPVEVLGGEVEADEKRSADHRRQEGVQREARTAKLEEPLEARDVPLVQ